MSSRNVVLADEMFITYKAAIFNIIFSTMWIIQYFQESLDFLFLKDFLEVFFLSNFENYT